MKDLKNIIRIGLVVGGAAASYYLYSLGHTVYHSPVGENIRNSAFPLIGAGAGISEAFATADEEIRNRGGWKHYTKGIGLGTLVGAVPTVLWDALNGTGRYHQDALKGQSPFAQSLEDIVGVGVTLGAMYAVTAIAMNGYEWLAKKMGWGEYKKQRPENRPIPVEATRIQE